MLLAIFGGSNSKYEVGTWYKLLAPMVDSTLLMFCNSFNICWLRGIANIDYFLDAGFNYLKYILQFFLLRDGS